MRRLQAEFLEAARLGQGVGLARWSLIQDELAAQRLSVVFPRTSPLAVGHAYHLVGLKETFRRTEVAEFRAWLLKELSALGRPPRRGK